MDPTNLPQFSDIRWRWIAYAASALVVAATTFAFTCPVEIKQDVPCEIVSSAEVKIQGVGGLVSAIYVEPSTRVEQGAPLFRLQRDLSLSSDGRPRVVFDEAMRNAQIEAADNQFQQRAVKLRAQLDTSRATEASRQAELHALDEQLAQTRLLADESAGKLARLQSAAEFVTADGIEQASADLHQAKATVAQGAARREQLRGEIRALRGTCEDLDAQMKELDARHARDLQDIRLRFEQSRQDVTVSAPKAGVVTFSSLLPGRMIGPDEVALVIATGRPPSARGAAYSIAAARFRAGWPDGTAQIRRVSVRQVRHLRSAHRRAIRHDRPGARNTAFRQCRRQCEGRGAECRRYVYGLGDAARQYFRLRRPPFSDSAGHAGHREHRG
jgi:membrane fusion protein